VAPQKQNRDYYEREDVDTTIPKGPKQMDWENQRRRDSTSSPIQQQYSLGYIDQLIASKNREELEEVLYIGYLSSLRIFFSPPRLSETRYLAHPHVHLMFA
jgi:hypothetical protein